MNDSAGVELDRLPGFVGDLCGRRRGCQLDAGFGKPPNDLEVDPLTKLTERPVVWRLVPVVNDDAERVGIELLEIDARWSIGRHAFVVLQDISGP